MPDPDLPPVILDAAYIDKIKNEMPVLPQEWRERLSGFGLDVQQIETLLEADVEEESVNYLLLIESQQASSELTKFLANWFVNLEIPLRRDGNIKNISSDKVRSEIYIKVFELFSAKKLSSTNIKALLTVLLESENVPDDIETFAQAEGYIQVSDEGEISKIVQQVLEENPNAAADVKNGEMKAIGFLVGQVMKNSKGKANPSMAQVLIKKLLDI